MATIFQADLCYMPVQDIFQWIDMNRLSCLATITSADVEDVTFYMEEGKIIFAASRKSGCRLGEYLVRAGILTDAQAGRALVESERAGVLFTTFLVENGLTSSGILSDIFAQMVENLLVDIFSLKRGTVVVSTPLPEQAQQGPIRLETGRTIFDAVRVFDEMKRDAGNFEKSCEEINRRLYNGDFELPAMPGIITNLVRMMDDEKSTFQDIAKQIMTDQVLISCILRVANSPFYGGRGQVDSLQFAIVRLGMRQIRNILIAIQVRSMKFKDVPQEELQKILDNSMKIAFMAGGLAQSCRLDHEEAFIGGLLLDLGKTVILNVARDISIEKPQLDKLIDSQHAEIGAMIARKWNYPESIQHMIRYHHNRNFGGISNRMIDVIQVAERAITSECTEEESEQLQSLGITHETLFDVYDKALETFSQIKEI